LAARQIASTEIISITYKFEPWKIYEKK